MDIIIAPPTLLSLQTLILTSTSLPQLKQIHTHLLKSPLQHHHHHLTTPFLSKLLSLSLSLSSSPSLDYAASAFLHSPSPRLTNRILRHLSRSSNNPRSTLFFYARIRNGGIPIDRFCFPPVLRAAARAGGEREGKEVHGLAVRMGVDSDPFVQTGLVGAYAGVWCVNDARRVFDGMLYRDIVAWSVMMDGYCQSGSYDEAFRLFEDMKSSGMTPDPVILATVLTACTRTRNLSFGRTIHSYIAENNLPVDARLHTSLLTMYSYCGSMDSAQKLYDELTPKNPAASTAMLSGYAKLGQIDIARSLFNSMADKDLVAWSAMISCYAESDQPSEALKLFNQMQLSGVLPDEITMLSIISACANLGALDRAYWVRTYVIENGFGRALSVRNALIDMFSKCGALVAAREVFDAIPKKNVISWTAMITALAMHGEGLAAISLFDQMKAEGVKPNEVTFVGLLYACSHSGLVDQGRQVFKSMTLEFGLEPEQQHYGCMVDLFGRAELFKDAVNLIESMPFQPNVVVWGSLLSACRVHGEAELGERAAKQILELDPGHDGAYVLLSNLYAKDGRWGEVGEVRRLMRCQGVSKERGCSWTELDGEVHGFLMGDESHPRTREIYDKLDAVVKELEEVAGYDPDLGSVLVDMEDEEEKRGAVLLHSEKLALCFRLISSDEGSTIRIAKNLRVCEDCHSFMKLASKVYGRHIVVRDRTRFHHYRDGVCSCGDFW